MFRIFAFAVLCIFWTGSLQAQDPFFSQFYANPVYLNPAYAGLDPGTQLTLNYRDQWFGLPEGGYRTSNATLNQQIPCFANMTDGGFGVAASFFKDQAGSAPLTTSGGALAASFEYGGMQPDFELLGAKLERLDFRIGAQYGYLQNRLDEGRFIYSFQLDPTEGLVGDPSTLNLASDAYSSLNLGGMIRGAFKYGTNGYTLFTLGASISNVNEPNVSLQPGVTNVTLPRRTTLHFGVAQRLSTRKGTSYRNPTYFSPQFRWDSQYDGKLNLYTFGAYVLRRGLYTGAFYQFNTPNQPATNTGASIGGRNSAAMIISAGVDLRSLMDRGERWHKRKTGMIVGFTYDVPVGGTGSAGALGSLELNCRLLLHQLKKRDCNAVGRNELYKGATCPVSF